MSNSCEALHVVFRTFWVVARKHIFRSVGFAKVWAWVSSRAYHCVIFCVAQKWKRKQTTNPPPRALFPLRHTRPSFWHCEHFFLSHFCNIQKSMVVVCLPQGYCMVQHGSASRRSPHERVRHNQQCRDFGPMHRWLAAAFGEHFK